MYGSMYRCGEVAAYATVSPGNGSVSGIFSWAKASKQHVAWLTNVILSFGTSLGGSRKGGRGGIISHLSY